jgi:adenylate cyclase
MEDQAEPRAMGGVAEGANPLSKIRHSLRTPLNQILGYSEMLQEEAAELGQEDYLPDLQKVHAAGQQLLALINEQLAPTRVATGRFDLAEFQRDGRTLLNLIVGYSELCEEYAAEVQQGSIGGDLRRIQTAAGNLLALLSDTAFLEPLTRPRPVVGAMNATPGRFSGTGTAIGRGMGQVGVLEAQGLVGRVLVVDDNEMNRDMLSRRLERQGHQVLVAENGMRALELLRSARVDLILLDILMPELDGLQTWSGSRETRCCATLR